ncbi:FAD linked oxidase [Streptomyces sp. WAC 06738]|nr:FAD linked oxidase [Streptomyces sp. WAC 06738]
MDGDLLTASSARAPAAADFGHLVHRMPLAVLRPGSVEDIAAMIRWASASGKQLAARGRGHSVYGRSQVDGGIVVDMSGHDGIGHVGRDRVVVDAGATWRAVLARTLPARRTPPVLTNYLDLTVGGTLSVGGIGGTTNEHGMQTDHVLELEAVTGEGKVVTCSPSENSGLFDSVRAGLGQFGIITRATLALVPAPDRARRYVLSYPDLEGLVAGQRHVLRDTRADHLQGAILPGGDRWQYQLEMVVFHPSDEPPNDALVLDGLRDDRSRSEVEDISYEEYLELFDRFEHAQRSTGEWSRPHPWLTTFLPGSAAERVARGVLRDLAPGELGGLGRIMLYPIDPRAVATPLVRLPDEPVVFAFNLIRSGPQDADRIERMVEENRALYERVRDAGGCLYPVSALELTADDWAEHFGPLWPTVRRAKERFDPQHVLTPGYHPGAGGA